MAKGKKMERLRYPVDLHWSDEDETFIAEIYDLPGCIADGETEEKAIKAAHEVARLWIEVAQEEGRDVPTPSTMEPASGKLNVRMPISLHRELQRQARREHVSLNQHIVALLAARAALQRDHDKV
jgi:predicted RNase H-like HicB family nuclease